MKILVTGGAGYIGSSLIPKLLEANYKVCVVDNLSFNNGYVLMPYINNSKFKFIKGDVRDPRIMSDLVHNFEFVIHLASIVGFPACKRDPDLARSVNVGSTKLLSSLLSKDQGVFYASTPSNYGDVSVDICDEDTPLNPNSLYGETKTEAEKIMLNENSATAYRFSTAFGVSPRMRLDLLINDFVYQAVTNKALIMFERKFQRSFIHISDMVRGILFAIESFDKMKGEVYNLGGDINDINKEDVALMIKDKIDYYLHFAEINKDEEKRDYKTSYKKINELGFEIKTTVRHGIDELLRAMPLLENSNIYKNA